MERKPVPRLTKTDVSNVQLEEPQTHFYTGEENSQIFKKIPAFHSKSNILPWKFLCKKLISKHKTETKAML